MSTVTNNDNNDSYNDDNRNKNRSHVPYSYSNIKFSNNAELFYSAHQNPTTTSETTGLVVCYYAVILTM